MEGWGVMDIRRELKELTWSVGIVEMGRGPHVRVNI